MEAANLSSCQSLSSYNGRNVHDSTWENDWICQHGWIIILLALERSLQKNGEVEERSACKVMMVRGVFATLFLPYKIEATLSGVCARVAEYTHSVSVSRTLCWTSAVGKYTIAIVVLSQLLE